MIANTNQPDTEKLAQLASMETEPLFTFKGVFPFDFFRDTVTIYRNRISVIKKTFFIVTQTTNIPIENINYITAHASWPFASLEISDRYFSEQPIIISTLWPADAQQALKIIDGLRLAINQQIDVSKISKDELLRDVLKIGVAT